MAQDCRGQKIALLAHCLLNQNAKVYGLAQYAAQATGLAALLERYGYAIYQLPCPEIYAAGLNRWGQVKEQYSNRAMSRSYQAAVDFTWDNIADYAQQGYRIILIGLDGSPSCGVSVTESNPAWGGSFTCAFPEQEIEMVAEPGAFMELLLAKLAQQQLAPLPAIGVPLDVQGGVLDLAAIESFLKQLEQ